MTILDRIRKGDSGILVMGNHPPIIQSILDFDFLSGKRTPSVRAIVTGTRKAEKFFFGTREVLIPCFSDVSAIPKLLRSRIYWMLNVQSGRRAYEGTLAFLEALPHAHGGALFAENVPERHATGLIKRFSGSKFVLGPASVGFLVPGALKLGAVGGVQPEQLKASALTTPGSIAVGSTSGGMTNELIRAVIGAGKRISFAAAVGGDRFPVASLTELFILAEADRQTKAFVYFGELGGADEYEIVELIRTKRFTKPLVAYIAGVIDEAFTEHVQFGHAKAFAAHKDESARAKRDALRKAGAVVPDTFPEFMKALETLPGKPITDKLMNIEPLMNRQKSILSTRTVIDTDRAPVFVRGKKLARQDEHAFVRAALGALLGKPVRSDVTAAFAEGVFGLLIDHGGNVSGAVNTMITARAGKDLVSSLAAGLLTIGPRFGGALNGAAHTWIQGVASRKTAADFVEERTKAGELIPGIGHRKYRVGIPDPRVAAISGFATLLKKHPHYDFAREVEKVTTAKNGALILNVDGAVAALLLDILAECEGLPRDDLRKLANAEFFNAFFVIPRSVGFIAHFLEQKQNDEGLFRLPDELLFVRKTPGAGARPKPKRKR